MTILDRVLRELEMTRGPVSTSRLSQRLGVDPAALAGMLGTLEARGALVGDSDVGEPMACASTSGCGSSCTGIDQCAFIIRMPPTQRLVIGAAKR